AALIGLQVVRDALHPKILTVKTARTKAKKRSVPRLRDCIADLQSADRPLAIGRTNFNCLPPASPMLGRHRKVVGYPADYKSAIQSRRRGTLRFWAASRYVARRQITAFSSAAG